MKVRHMIIGALMTVIAAPVMAQAQTNEIMNQVSAIIKSGASDANKQVQAIAKANKKDINAIVSIGKAYLAAKDYANAKVYAQQAVDMAGKEKEKIADPYVLMGNIAVGEDDGGTAAQWFQQAIYFAPKSPDGYRRYAQIMSKTDPAGAVQTLEDLRAQLPDYPVDLIAAEIYSEAGKMAKANEYYAKVSLDKMKDYQISDYATNLFLSQQYDKSLDIAKQGHAKFARNASFNRLIMFNNTEKKDYEAALVGANDLFNNSDSLKASAFDYGYYARALKGDNKYAEAVTAYQKLQQLEGIDNDTKNQANKDISDCYKKLSDYDKAAEYLQKWAQSLPQQSFTAEEAAALLYADQLADEKSTAEVKKTAYEKADALYAQLAEKYPDNAAYIANKRATMPFSLTSDQMAALKMAGPHYVTFADLLAADANRSAGQTKMLINAYNTIVAYYVHSMNDMDKAKEVAQKLIELDPENANAKAILGIE